MFYSAIYFVRYHSNDAQLPSAVSTQQLSDVSTQTSSEVSTQTSSDVSTQTSSEVSTHTSSDVSTRGPVAVEIRGMRPRRNAGGDRRPDGSSVLESVHLQVSPVRASRYRLDSSVTLRLNKTLCLTPPHSVDGLSTTAVKYQTVNLLKRCGYLQC